jgi:hypothetical protein
MKNGSCSATTVDGGTALPFVISTEAYPDFLLRAAGNDHVCGFPLRKPHDVDQRHGSRQEIRGSAVERSAVSGSFLEMFFDRGIMGLRPTQGDEKCGER